MYNEKTSTSIFAVHSLQFVRYLTDDPAQPPICMYKTLGFSIRINSAHLTITASVNVIYGTSSFGYGDERSSIFRINNIVLGGGEVQQQELLILLRDRESL